MNNISRYWHTLPLLFQLRLLILIPLITVNLLFGYAYIYQSYYKDVQYRQLDVKLYSKQLVPAVQFALTHPDKQTNLQDLAQSASNHPDIKAISIYNEHKKLLAYHGIPIPFPLESNQKIKKHKFIDSHTLITPIDSLSSGAKGWLILKIDPYAVKINYYSHVFTVIFINMLSLLMYFLASIWLNKVINKPLSKLKKRMRSILKNTGEHELTTEYSSVFDELDLGIKSLQKQYLNIVQDLNHQVEVSTADLQQSLELLEEKNIELSMEKKKIEEKLTHNAQFIANMSHELRTPMNGILGFLEILSDTPLNILQKDYVKTIQSSSKNLLNIINDILDYSKLDAGKLNIDCFPLNLHNAIDEVVAIASPMLNKKDIEFFISLDTKLPKIILGDGLRLKQILQNLLFNAIKFTEIGHIMIEVRLEKETKDNYQIKFIIEDTGIGMTPAEKKQLFNPFYQTQTTINKNQNGSGLGLVICKKLAEAMGGNIEVDSRPLNGTVFTAKILFKKLPTYEQEKIHLHNNQNINSIKIICIDTHPRSALALEQTLQSLNYNTVICQELSYLPIIMSEHPDIKLIIHHLYDQQLGTLEQILRDLPKLPCIVLTKHTLPSEFKQKITILPHPLQIQKLEEKIHGCLQTFPISNLVNNQQTQKLLELRNTLQLANVNILVAEDNPVNRLLIETLLSPYCIIHLVHDGEQAVAVSQQQMYDLIILDLHMPKKSGLDAAISIRKESGPNKSTPMIFMSANSTEISAQTLEELHISKCLQKPIDEASLLDELIQLTNTSETRSINWEQCLINLSNNHELAINCLIQFIEELKQNIDKLKQFQKTNDQQAIQDLAHSMKGACGFLAINPLKELSHKLEKEVFNLTPTQLNALLDQIYLEMNKVMMEAQNKINRS